MAENVSTATMRPASLMGTRTFDEGDPAAEPKRAGTGMGNPFTAEMSLLSSLTTERVSQRKEGGNSLPPPVPLEPGVKRRNVPALNDHELAMGEVQTLPAYGKMLLGKSSTDHSGIKEMQITRKAKHENAIQAYGKKVAAMEVTLETRTGHAGRGFKKLLTLNDEEIQATFDEMADEFLLEMELVDVNEMWDRLHEQTARREGWITDFEVDLQGVEGERRAMTELELGKLLDSLIETAHELPPALERMAELQVFEINLLILANREVHAQLMARVRRAEVLRQKQHRALWEVRLLEWRRLRHEQALTTFKALLHSQEVVQPPARKDLLKELDEQHVDFQKQREETAATLGRLAPPQLTEITAGRVRTALASGCYGNVSAAELGFLDYFAVPVAGLDDMAEAVIAHEIAGSRDYEAVIAQETVGYADLARHVRLLQEYEVLFWDAVFAAQPPP